MERFVMRSHILTPEADAYAVAVAVVFCLGIYSMSTLVQERWLSRWKHVDFWSVHVGTMTVVVLWCSFVLGVAAISHTTLRNALLSIPTGILLGWAAIWIDRAIVRAIARRDSRKRIRDRQGQRHGPLKSPRGLMPGSTRAISPGADSLSARRGQGTGNVRTPAARPSSNKKVLFTLWILILIAVLEEIIFRGFLVEACLMISQPSLRAAALAGTVVVFGIGHVQFGWTQVFAKLPLGALAMASVLSLKTVLPAIFIHALFNWKAWHDTDGDLRFIFRSTW
jgi:membrane protease YdiL (CAAX protease family)